MIITFIVVTSLVLIGSFGGTYYNSKSQKSESTGVRKKDIPIPPINTSTKITNIIVKGPT
jgi:hypothetical protein